MTIFIRPGPYVCAEWDFGGLPSRLLSIDGMVVRSYNEPFLDETFEYMKAVNKIISPFFRTP